MGDFNALKPDTTRVDSIIFGLFPVRHGESFAQGGKSPQSAALGVGVAGALTAAAGVSLLAEPPSALEAA